MIERRRKVPVRGKRRAVSEVPPLRILIAEDNRDSADSLKTLLESGSALDLWSGSHTCGGK